MSTNLDSGFLSTTYRQYKKDTEYIAGWLVEASKKIGFSLNSGPAPTPAESQRLKGKDRKKAKEAAKESAKSQPSAYHIRTVDFIPIAEAIAKQAKKVKVPSPLLTVFGRAIKARKEAQAWYKSAKLEDEGHNHFINILSRVQEILRPLVPVARAVKPEKSNGVDNRFKKLTVEEVADTSPKEKVERQATLPPVVTADIEQSEEEAEEEFFFAIHSFLAGIHEIQDVVQDSWFKTQDFNRDLMASALLTNTAIDLVRRAESEFDLHLKRPSRYPVSKFPVWSLPALLYHHYHPLPDDVKIQKLVVPSDVSIQVNADEYDKIHANWCFWPAYTGLRFCVNRIKKFPYLDANEEELQAIGAESVPEIKRTFELAKAFRVYTSAHQRFWAQDEVRELGVTRGMKIMFTDKVVPIWVTFGIQMLLDIQDIKDNRMGEGKGFNSSFTHARVTLEDELNEWPAFDEWEAPFPELFGPHTPSGDERSRCRDTMDIYHQLMEHSDIPALKYNPIRCGLIKYDVYFQLHICGWHLERHSGLVCVLGHLYTAGKLLYPNDPTWPDMEYLLYSQDPNHIFYGGIPKTLDESYRKINLAFGSRMPRVDSSGKYRFHKSSRLFQETSLLSPVLESRMTGWSDHTNDSVDKLATSLNTLLCDKASQGRLARQLGASRDWVEGEIDTRRVVRLFEDGPADGSPVLLRDLSLFIEGEMQNVYFDWISMYRICGDIWKELLSELAGDPVLEKLMPKPTPGLGLHILKIAAEDAAKQKKIDLNDPDLAPQLRKVWACIQRVIHKRSSHEFSPKYKMCTAWLGDECLAQQMARTYHTVAWQLVGYNVPQLYKFYDNWDSDDKRVSGVLAQIVPHRQMNEIYRERNRDLLLGGLRDECIEDKYHSNDYCGRCRRRNFFLDHYGSVASLRGTELVQKHLGRKYHGQDDKSLEEDDVRKTVLKKMFEENGITFIDSDGEEGDEGTSGTGEGEVIEEHENAKIRPTVDGKFQVEMSVRTLFHRPGVWQDLGSARCA
ncbi:hypothetical protein J4E93_005948 [Alternaria ventricosa]|uniref:uncharacterized protein n=1 Tax=Alternaria ventricosa TaxID=1187951 RepID=UPI0020C5A8F0|nr:uncharacterized protein J4E93_005948 [Alternaria ventricosa]KAI4645148.1 hypothetical protein J4E93_005948 [Alternaria ventricosa]